MTILQIRVDDRAAGTLTATLDGAPLPERGWRLDGDLPMPVDAAALQPVLAAAAAKPGVLHDKVLAKTCSPEQLASYGQYLFHTAVGPAWWDQVPRGEPVTVELCWKPDLWPWTRLLWEAMHDGTEFLSKSVAPPTAIVRRVGLPAAAPTASVQLPLRVLFVVGVSVESELRVHPGAEYLGLLRVLEGNRHLFEQRIVLDASLGAVEKAVADFRPGVVHFICHGTPRQVQLRAEPGAPAGEVSVDHTQLLPAISAGGMKPVVILNACDTNGSPVPWNKVDRFDGVPLAAQLVDQGLPLVVGMSGRVADSACRLFTRGFYEALVLGSEAGAPVDLAASAATGRRAALQRAPSSAVDWVFPVTLLAKDVPTTSVVVADAERRRRRTVVAQRFLRGEPFCGRIESLGGFDAWLPDARRKPVAVLDGTTEPGLGLTWTLSEFARRAALQGFFPVLVSRFPDTKIGTSKDVVGEIVAALKRYARPPAGEPLPPETERLFRSADALSNLDDDDEIADQLRECLTAAQRHPSFAGRGLLVLLDGVHGFVPFYRHLSRFVDSTGLGTADATVPVVVGLKCSPDDLSNEITVSLRKWVKSLDTTRWELKRLQYPDLALRHHLLLRAPALVADESHQYAGQVFDMMLARLDRLPSNLPPYRELPINHPISTVIEMGKTIKVILEPDDDARLRAMGLAGEAGEVP